jgi:hypothetical protein
MTTTANFEDFVLSTTQAYLRGPRVVIREAVQNTYLFGELMVGAGMRDILQGGAKISDSLTLSDPGLAQTYGGGDDTFTWRNPQTLVGWDVEWRFALTHFSWTDQERALQGTGDMTQRARFMRFKDVYDNKVGTAYLSLYNLLEALLFRVPNKNEMESASGDYPYPIWAFVNEQANGLFNSDTTAGPGGAWTQVEGINPTDAGNERWVPAKETYANLTPQTADNLLEAQDAMALNLTYKPFRGGRDVFERSMKGKKMILASKFGWTSVVALMRNSQDVFVTRSRQDPDYNNPMHAGVPYVYCSQMNDAAVYPLGTGLGTESTATNGGPRFPWIDAEYLRPVFHRERFIKQHTVKEHPNQPFTKIVPVDVWYNMVCRSRQRLGIVYPSQDLVA